MTTYAVCPHCRTLHPVGVTFNETAYAVYRAALIIAPRGARLKLDVWADTAHVSYSTVHKYARRLADAGLIERVPMGKLHWYRLPVRQAAGEGQDRVAGEPQQDSRADRDATVNGSSIKRDSSALTGAV